MPHAVKEQSDEEITTLYLEYTSATRMKQSAEMFFNHPCSWMLEFSGSYTCFLMAGVNLECG